MRSNKRQKHNKTPLCHNPISIITIYNIICTINRQIRHEKPFMQPPHPADDRLLCQISFRPTTSRFFTCRYDLIASHCHLPLQYSNPASSLHLERSHIIFLHAKLYRSTAVSVTGHFILINGVSAQSSFFLMLGIKRVLNRHP